MKTSRVAKIRFMVLGLFFVSSTVAYAASDNLSRFVGSSGKYAVSSDSAFCTARYSHLDLDVDAQNKVINLLFIGNGNENGIPTAGQEQIFVSRTETYDRPHFPGTEKLRIVIKNNTIVVQSSIGEFGIWKEDRKLLQFVKTSKILLYGKDGVPCQFVRN
ncbi:hypothetical protein [Bdellovibrio sp. HCB337]|uniref:hypothetical protein n=1 Tax=Bdellovibrio sp. HCB337 TaxID=3394358 RepID=UPI0039A4E08C